MLLYGLKDSTEDIRYVDGYPVEFLELQLK